jgi:DNA-binding transcriptional regulator LsrR (DeoR family)
MATTTFITTGAEDARIVVAFGKYLNLPGNATQAQVKAAIREFIVNVVKTYEQQAAVDAAVAGVGTINPT